MGTEGWYQRGGVSQPGRGLIIASTGQPARHTFPTTPGLVPLGFSGVLLSGLRP